MTWHYHGLNALKDKYDNFEVLGFPCNQFGMQEPGSNETEILNGIKYVRPGGGFVPRFPMFAKLDVNGELQHPLFEFLKNSCPPTRDEFAKGIFYDPKKNSDIRWNFEKFLIDMDGRPVTRYDPQTNPMEIAKDIESALERREANGARITG